MKINKKAQNLVEYIIISAIIIAALLGFSSVLKKGVEDSLNNVNTAMVDATEEARSLLIK